MPRTIARKVLELEARAILDLVPRLGEAFDQAVDTLGGCKGRVVVTGMGARLRRVYQAVLWLCSPLSSFVTGAVIPIDGGQSAGSKPPQMYRQGQPMSRQGSDSATSAGGTGGGPRGS